MIQTIAISSKQGQATNNKIQPDDCQSPQDELKLHCIVRIKIFVHNVSKMGVCRARICT